MCGIDDVDFGGKLFLFMHQAANDLQITDDLFMTYLCMKILLSFHSSKLIQCKTGDFIFSMKLIMNSNNNHIYTALYAKSFMGALQNRYIKHQVTQKT